MFKAAEMLARTPRLTGERLAILTNGGGAGVLAADRLADFDGRLAELSPTSRAALEAVLPPTWSHGNPVDIIGDAGPDRYGRAMARRARGRGVGRGARDELPDGARLETEQAARRWSRPSRRRIRGPAQSRC